MRRLVLALFILCTVEAWGQPLFRPTSAYRSISMWPDSSKVVFKDTTLAISAKRIVGVNLHDPAQIWDYGAFRSAEKQTSLVQVDRKRVPDLAALVVSTAGDTLKWIDLSAPSSTAVRWYRGYGNNALGASAINELAFLDGVIHAATAGNYTRLDELKDQVDAFTTGGNYIYKGPISSRNNGLAWQAVPNSPSIVNSTVNAVAAIRSPWAKRLDGHRDALGRAVQYWAAGTASGLASMSSYNSIGTLSIFDYYAGVYVSRALYAMPNGKFLSCSSDPGVTYWIGSYNMFPVSADSWVEDQSLIDWNPNRTGSRKLRWATTTIPVSVAALGSASSGGNNSPRIFAAADSGLYILDAKVGDNTNGSKQEINARYVSPMMTGNVMMAFSPASTADVTGRRASGAPLAVFTAASTPPTFSADAASPLGAKWTFNGTQVQRISDHDSLTFLAGQPMSISAWVNITGGTGTNRGIVRKNNEWAFYVDGNEDLVCAITDSSSGGYIGRAWNTTFASGWHMVTMTYTGGTTSAACQLFCDGNRVDNADNQSSTFAGTDATSSPVTIGAMRTTFYLNYFVGSMTPPVITREALTAQQIQDEYQRGLRMIQSPTPDTLMANNVLRVKVQPYTGNVMLVHPGSVEIRDRWGALSDTFACADCGTLADGDFLRVAGVDSLGGGIIFGGQTKSRLIAPDPKLWDAANYRYPYEPYEITMPAIVDSAGGGHFWTVQDAISAMSNVGRVFARIARGTYPNPITTVPTGAVLEGSGVKTVISNASDVTKEALVVGGDSVIVRDVAVRTAGNSGGGGKDAISLTGDGILLEQVSVLDADDDGISIASGSDRDALVDVAVSAADNYGLTSAGRELQVRGGRYYGALRGMYLNGRRSQIEGTAITAGVANDTTLVFAAGADSTLFLGNDVRGHITVGTGDTATTLIGNNRLNAGKITDYGTGTRSINNTGSVTDTNKVVQPTKIGTADNHTMTDANGHQWMVGLARPWRDERNDALSIKNTGTKVTESLVNGTLDFATDADTSHYAIVNIQLNHDRDLTSVISPHIHWLQTENASPHWVVGYRWIKQGARFDSLAATTQWEFVKCGTLVTTYSSGSVHQISEMADITPPAGSAISDIVQFRILRDTADRKTKWGSSDTYSTAVSMLAFDVHIQTNSLGSSSEYIK